MGLQNVSQAECHGLINKIDLLVLFVNRSTMSIGMLLGMRKPIGVNQGTRKLKQNI